MSKTCMKKIICQAALAAALVSLVGCGLKGPLYFPPKDQPVKTQQKTANSQTPQTSASSSNKGAAGTQVSQ